MTELYQSTGKVSASIVATDDVAIANFNLEVGGELFTGTGSAKRNPIDTPDVTLSGYIAAARALRALAKDLQKEANIRENENAQASAIKREAKTPKVKGGTQHPMLVGSKPKRAKRVTTKQSVKLSSV